MKSSNYTYRLLAIDVQGFHYPVITKIIAGVPDKISARHFDSMPENLLPDVQQIGSFVFSVGHFLHTDHCQTK